MLKECNITLDVMTLYCGYMNSINISDNQVRRSSTKHFDISHHFIRELLEEKVISLGHVPTEKQLKDIFSKSLDATQF